MLYIALYSLIQIIGEMLPISSSGHLVLFEYFLVSYANTTLNITPPSFDHFLHGPALIVIALFFFSRWFSKLVRAAHYLIFGSRSRWEEVIAHKVLRLFLLIIFADLITAFFYLMLHLSSETSLLLGKSGILACGFFTTGLALLSLRTITDNYKKTFVTFSATHTFILGFVQGCALLPGISRFALTYCAARHLHFSPRRALELSFLILAPLLGGGFIHGIYSIVEHDFLPFIMQPQFLATLAGGTIVSYFILWLVYRLILKQKAWIFGLYMILPLSASLLYAFFTRLN
jgi:undecaprenyl-diphosphatase